MNSSFPLSLPLPSLCCLKVYVPVDKKTVRPSVIGGRAGGEKYIVHNILFKFAVDSSNLFDGSNWAARKVCVRE